MNTSTSSRKSPLAFFLLVFALSIPFWVAAAMVRQTLPLPMNLPVSSLSVFCPLIAALILVRREDGPGGIKRLLRKVIDYKRIKRKIWYLPIIFGMPLIMMVSYAVMRLIGLPLPPQPRIPLLAAPVLFVVYFVAAAGEETGWMGYAVEPMQERWSALKTSLVLGSGWAVWHVTLYAQAHHDLAWIAWQSFSLVAVRLLIVWLYNNTGKAVLAAILFHDMMNVSQGLFPNSASHYDPAVTAPIIAIAAVIVTFLWGAKTLAQYRYTTAALPGRPEEASQ